jgi:hypothetical protein
MRVLRRTHAPLTLPGTLSTAGHWDQSSRAIVQFLSSFSVRDLASIVTPVWRYGFASGFQFRMSVIGTASPGSCVLMRKRPSGATS